MNEQEWGEVLERVDPHSDIGREHLAKYADIFLRVMQGVPVGPILEIGTRRGGSALLWLEMLKSIGQRRVVLTVDPYGDRPYPTGHIDPVEYRYGEDDYQAMKALLGPYPNHAHFRMTSEDFLRRCHALDWWDFGQPTSLGYFSFAFLDGDHDPVGVLADVLGLRRWMAPGGVVLVDNVNWKGEELRHSLSGIAPVVAQESRYVAIVLKPVMAPGSHPD